MMIKNVESQIDSMWSQWIIFDRFDTTNDSIQLKKQLHGLTIADFVQDSITLSIKKKVEA